MCRTGLAKWKDKCHVFTAEVGPISYNKQVLFNVKMIDDGGNIVGGCDHLLVAVKPFKNIPTGEMTRFTGDIYKYFRMDNSMDYSVKVNKAKQLV